MPESRSRLPCALAYGAVAAGIVIALVVVPHRGSPPPVPWFLFAAAGPYSLGMGVGLLRRPEHRPPRRLHVGTLDLHVARLGSLPIHAFAAADPRSRSTALGGVGHLSVLLGWVAAIPSYRTFSRGMPLLIVSVAGAAFLAGATWTGIAQVE